MTREEAIKRLEIIATNLCGQSAQNPNLWPDYKAVDMAISALRQQEQSGKNLLRSVQVIKYTCGAGTPEEAETNCTYFIRGECTASFCEYRMKKQTNADRIRAMNDEELAEYLFQVGYENGWGMKEYALEWLQQPCGEEDKHEAD